MKADKKADDDRIAAAATELAKSWAKGPGKTKGDGKGKYDTKNVACPRIVKGETCKYGDRCYYSHSQSTIDKAKAAPAAPAAQKGKASGKGQADKEWTFTKISGEAKCSRSSSLRGGGRRGCTGGADVWQSACVGEGMSGVCHWERVQGCVGKTLHMGRDTNPQDLRGVHRLSGVFNCRSLLTYSRSVSLGM